MFLPAGYLGRSHEDAKVVIQASNPVSPLDPLTQHEPGIAIHPSIPISNRTSVALGHWDRVVRQRVGVEVLGSMVFDFDVEIDMCEFVDPRVDDMSVLMFPIEFTY